MPFTPFHSGPGLLAKAVLGRHFSFVIFGATQVAMDIEPLLKLQGHLDGPVHGMTHTWPGAILIALAVFGLWHRARRAPGTLFAELRVMPVAVALISAFFGTFSHLVLDAWMHTDIHIALVSAIPDLPDPDRPHQPISFSEAVAVISAVLAPIPYLFRKIR